MSSMIIFRNITKFYDKYAALRDINFEVAKGELAFITGPSGAGKTTLLKLVYMGETPEEGQVIVDGMDTMALGESEVPFLRRNIGVVFQDFRLLINKNVYDNIALCLRIRGVAESEIRVLVNEILKMLNLRHKITSYPLTLSGGEQQRVVIARAIIGEPAILLADEPTGNLDPETAAGIMRVFKEINARGTTILIATHNRDLYTNSGHRVFRIEGGTIAGAAAEA